MNNEQPPKDKRTKAYKEWVKRQKGLGDTIEKITEATGIKKAVKAVFGNDCGCEERKQLLNVLKPYHCFTEQEFNYFQEYLNERHNPKHFEKNDVKFILETHRRIFRKSTKICLNCGSGIKIMNRLVNDLIKIYETY